MERKASFACCLMTVLLVTSASSSEGLKDQAKQLLKSMKVGCQLNSGNALTYKLLTSSVQAAANCLSNTTIGNENPVSSSEIPNCSYEAFQCSEQMLSPTARCLPGDPGRNQQILKVSLASWVMSACRANYDDKLNEGCKEIDFVATAFRCLPWKSLDIPISKLGKDGCRSLVDSKTCLDESFKSCKVLVEGFGFFYDVVYDGNRCEMYEEDNNVEK